MKNSIRENMLTEATILRLIKKAKQYESLASRSGSPGPGLLWLEESILTGAFRKEDMDYHDSDLNHENTSASGSCELCGDYTDNEEVSVCRSCESSVNESSTFYFDKHIDKILIAEHKHKSVDEKTPTPQRIRAKRHQDRPNNKIIFGSKK